MKEEDEGSWNGGLSLCVVDRRGVLEFLFGVLLSGTGRNIC